MSTGRGAFSTLVFEGARGERLMRRVETWCPLQIDTAQFNTSITLLFHIGSRFTSTTWCPSQIDTALSQMITIIHKHVRNARNLRWRHLDNFEPELWQQFVSGTGSGQCQNTLDNLCRTAPHTKPLWSDTKQSVQFAKDSKTGFLECTPF